MANGKLDRDKILGIIEEASFALRAGDDMSAVYHLWRASSESTSAVLGLELSADFRSPDRSRTLAELLVRFEEVLPTRSAKKSGPESLVGEGGAA